MNFIEKFPDEFVFERAMCLPREEFEYNFKDEIGDRIIGYIRIATGYELKAAIDYNGIKYCPVTEATGNTEPDRVFQVYFDDDNIISNYVYKRDIKTLKSGRYTVIPGKRYVAFREEN